MPANPVSLGSKRFRTKTEAAAYLKAMLHKYDVGDRVNAADAEILAAAVVLHPAARAKVGSGIASFSVRSADFGSKCFWINRTDGTTDKFSYRSCIFQVKRR